MQRKYWIVIRGNNIFTHAYKAECKDFEDAYYSACFTLKQYKLQITEQLRIAEIVEEYEE